MGWRKRAYLSTALSLGLVNFKIRFLSNLFEMQNHIRAEFNFLNELFSIANVLRLTKRLVIRSLQSMAGF